MENDDKKILSLEDVLAGIGPIVQADPTFTYPQQEETSYNLASEDERCKCVEVDTSDRDEGDYPEEYYLYADCPWHLDDDNTCRYVLDDGAPACVVGHYFYEELGMRDLNMFETKAPTFILEAHGYEVDPRAQRFLNTIQSQQDQGWDWAEAYSQAMKDAERYETQ